MDAKRARSQTCSDSDKKDQWHDYRSFLGGSRPFDSEIFNGTLQAKSQATRFPVDGATSWKSSYRTDSSNECHEESRGPSAKYNCSCILDTKKIIMTIILHTARIPCLTAVLKATARAMRPRQSEYNIRACEPTTCHNTHQQVPGSTPGLLFPAATL